MSRAAERAGWLALGALAFACASPRFELADLPEAPIAFVHRSVEENERVLDDAEQREKQKRGQVVEGELDVELERLQAYLGRRTPQDAARDKLGRVSFYVAPEKRLDVAEWARRGARPLEWSADHARLLFTASARDGIIQLFEWLAASGEIRQLTTGSQPHIDGCYGPGRAFAFVRLEPGGEKQVRARVWVRRPGEAPRPVTPGPADGQPTWSPDGSRLVYAATDPKLGGVLRWVDPASGEGGPLTRGRAPVFTRDGQWIVYSARTRKGWKLWRMRPDGSGKRSFGRSAFQENDPSVSPDGRFVVFSGAKTETTVTSRLIVRPIDGSPDRHLEVSGSALLPVW